MIELTTRNEERIRNESQILHNLRQKWKTFDSTLKIMPFGSATYGFGGSSNLNILVHAGSENKLKEIREFQ